MTGDEARKARFERLRSELATMDDEALKARFWALCDRMMDPVVELARTHTSPSIERSVLLRMGIDRAEVPGWGEAPMVSRLPGQALHWRTCELHPRPPEIDRKRWRQRWSAVEEERRRLDAELLPELEAIRTQVDGFREDCRDELGRLQGLKAGAEKARDLYDSRLGQLRAAKDAAVMQYREANLRVRTDLPPAYFSQGLNLAEIDQPAELPEYRAVRRQIEHGCERRDVEHRQAVAVSWNSPNTSRRVSEISPTVAYASTAVTMGPTRLPPLRAASPTAVRAARQFASFRAARSARTRSDWARSISGLTRNTSTRARELWSALASASPSAWASPKRLTPTTTASPESIATCAR